MPIYEKPTRELMHDFAKTLDCDQIFSKQHAIQWFSENYPKINKTTVALHVDGMSVNSTQRKHHPSIKPGRGWDLFFKISSKEFRLWNRETDPEPIYKADLEISDELEPATPDDQEIELLDPDTLGSREFAFEKDLQNYLVNNLHLLESGLQLYTSEDSKQTGVEFPAGKRYIDILGVGKDGGLVVVETKVSRAYDSVVGQLFRYMGWIKQNMANGRPVRGIIVASNISDDLKLAASLTENVKLIEYEITFSLKEL